MEYITFSDSNEKLKYAIFIKSSSANKQAIRRYYIDPLEKLGIGKDEIVVVSVPAEGKKYKTQETKDL